MRFLTAFLIFVMATSFLMAAFEAFPVVKGGANLQVISHSSYYTENKHSYFIIGEVQNIGDQAARVTSIIATVFNSKKEVMATLTAYEASSLYILLPGQKSPFSMGIHHYDIPIENYRQFDHYSIGAEFTLVPMPAKGLKILTHKGELLQVGDVKGDYKISGVLQYTGTEKAYWIRILATAYDSSGQIVGTSSASNVYRENAQTGLRDTRFEPNQIGNFEIYIPQGRASLVASYSLTGEIPQYETMDGKVFPHYALDTGQATAPSPSPSPVLPNSAARVDRSNITPVNQIEDVPTGQPHVFEYKNLTLVFETKGAPVTLNLTAVEINSQTLKLFVELEEATRLNVALAREAAIDQQEAMAKQALASIGFYMDLEQHSSPNMKATFGLHIDQSKLNEELGRIVDASCLSWFYWNAAEQAWIPVASHIDQDGYLVCETNHFSIWAVAELQSESYSVTAVPLEYLVATTAIIIVIMGIFVVKKRK